MESLGSEDDLNVAQLRASVSFSRTGDPGSGKFKDAVMLRSFGEVPDDLSTALNGA